MIEVHASLRTAKWSVRKSEICLERDRGIEPLSQPWQGRVLPLYQSRNWPI
jgi:hypothetical protein